MHHPAPALLQCVSVLQHHSAQATLLVGDAKLRDKCTQWATCLFSVSLI